MTRASTRSSTRARLARDRAFDLQAKHGVGGHDEIDHHGLGRRRRRLGFGRTGARSGSTAGRVSHIDPFALDPFDPLAGSRDAVSVRAGRAGELAGSARRSGRGVVRAGREAASRRGLAVSTATASAFAGDDSGAITPSDSVTGFEAAVVSAGASAGAGEVTAAGAVSARCELARYPPAAAAARHPKERAPKMSLFSSMMVREARRA